MEMWKNRNLKLWVFVLVCLLAASMLSARGGQEAREGGMTGKQVVIKIWDWQAGPAFDGAFEGLKPAYEKLHPNVMIQRTGYNLSEWDELIKTALQSRDLPDLFGLYQGPQLWQVADTGILYEWDDAINADPVWKANLGSNYKLGGTLDSKGNTVAIPMDIFYIMCWGFRNVLADLGRSEQDVRNLGSMKELADFCQRLNATGDPRWYLSTGFAGGYMIRELFWTFVYQQSYPEDIMRKAEFQEGGFKFTDERFVNAARAVTYMSKMTRPDVLSLDYQTDHYKIMSNQEAWGSLYDGPWATAILLENPPAIDNVFGFWHPPVAPGAKANVLAADGGQVLAMAKDNPNKDYVIEFMKFVHSPEGTPFFIKNLVHPAGKFPDNWRELAPHKVYAELVDMYNESIISPWICYTGEIETACIYNLSKVFTGELTPEAGMATVQASVEQYWASQ